MVSSISQQQQIAMQAGQNVPVDVEKIKQSADNSYIANRVKASATDEQQDMLLKAGVGTAIWYGIAQGMDVFNKSCAQDYDKTLFGKLGNWGDRIAVKFNRTFIGRHFNNFVDQCKKTGQNITKKSDIAYSLANHSTSPEWAFAKTPSKGLHGYLGMDMKQVFDEYLEPINQNSNKLSWITGKKVNTQRLENYGMKQSDIDAFTKTLKGKTFAEKSLMLQKKELELLGYKTDLIEHIAQTRGAEGLERIAYARKVRNLGFKSVKDYKRVSGDILKYSDEVMEALERATKSSDLKVGICRRNGSLGGINNHLVGRITTLKEYLNKYKATLGKGKTTAFGRFLAKSVGWLTEGCTNRWAGGKIAVGMQAFIFADMAVHTIKAPWGEKGKTLAERFVNDFTYFMALPLGIMGMHKIGGLKYAGMTTEQVKAYREALKQFNADVKAGLLSDKNAYKARSKALKDMLKADVKNPITKLLKKVGGFINIGNETKLARRSVAKFNMNWIRRSGNFFKNLAGVPMRIAIPMMIVSPFLAKLTTKGVHKLIGKPTKSVLDEDNEESKEQPKTPNAAEQKALEEALKKAAMAKQTTSHQVKVPQSSSNLINQYVNKNQSATLPVSGEKVHNQSATLVNPNEAKPLQNSATLVNSNDANVPQSSETLVRRPLIKDATEKLRVDQSAQNPVRRYIPSPECEIPKETPKPKYVPSPESNIQPEAVRSTDELDRVLKRVDRIEQDAAKMFGVN